MADETGTITAYVPRVARPCGFRTSRGFTLVELMVVVVLVGVLSIAGVVMFREHVASSHGVEAAAGIQAIRSAEESWRAEHLTYLNVSEVLTDYYPTPQINVAKRFGGAGPDKDAWAQLHPDIRGATQFGFSVVAGSYGDAYPALDISGAQPWPGGTLGTEPWYVIQAKAWPNGKVQVYAATSFSAELYSEDGN
jgi:prepilin-type N-terminal cleavage/methylation domain-containing protein